MKTVIMLGLCAVLASGCTSSGPKLDLNQVAQHYYTQQRTFESVKLTGANRINIEGNNMTLALSNELDPLSVMSNGDNSAKMMDAAASVARTAILGYAGMTVMNKMAAQPQVVETRPEIVRPEVVEPTVITTP